MQDLRKNPTHRPFCRPSWRRFYRQQPSRRRWHPFLHLSSLHPCRPPLQPCPPSLHPRPRQTTCPHRQSCRPPRPRSRPQRENRRRRPRHSQTCCWGCRRYGWWAGGYK